MRNDLDHLMQERHLDAFIIPATESHNPYRDYLTGGIHAAAMVIKKIHAEPILLVVAMERDEAAKSGLRVVTLEEIGRDELARQHGAGTPAEQIALWGRILETFGLRGRLTFFGAGDFQNFMRLLRLLETHYADRLEIVLDESFNIFEAAYETKEGDELSKLRDSGQKTSEVVRLTRAWLGEQRIKDGLIIQADGHPLTIGAVKAHVRMLLMQRGLDDGGVMIFAQGRDAGVPHSRGEDNAPLRAGETIVFDLFPFPIGGGYYHDMTRTWCLGYASEEVQRDFNLVLEVFHRSLEGLEAGQPTSALDKQVCGWFEAHGHPTRLNTPGTTEGYVHSLGHGIGLNIHEKPSVSSFVSDSMVFRSHNVVTIEPGLYYPSKGYGMRVEDTVYLDEHGQVHILTDCPYDLVIPIQEAD